MRNAGGSVLKYLTRAGRLWRYRFDADPVDGKRRMISKQGFATRGAAMTALQDAIKEYQESKTLPVSSPPPPQKETVGDWMRAWLLNYAPHQCSPKTIERYHQLAGYLLNATEGAPAALAATALVDLKHTAVEGALYALLRMPAMRREHLSPKSIREIAGVLRVSLNEAFRLDKILVNPLLKVKLPKVERTEARALTQEEMERLRSVCRGDWTLTFVDISLATGARRGELLALEWADVDWLTATLMVSKSLEQTKAGLRVKRPKSGRVRKFRLGQTAIASLRFLHEQQQEHRKLLGPDYQGQLGVLPARRRTVTAGPGISDNRETAGEGQNQKRQPAYFTPHSCQPSAFERRSVASRQRQTRARGRQHHSPHLLPHVAR